MQGKDNQRREGGREEDRERERGIYIFLHSPQNSNLLLTKCQECDGDNDAISSVFGQINRTPHGQIYLSFINKC